MKHFIITRFNLKGKKNLNNNNVFNPLSSNWLEDRFNIFNSYCLPSVLHQTNKNFLWLVCFDTDTPKKYISKINTLKDECLNFIPVYVDGFENLTTSIQASCKSYLEPTDKFVITTRMDNDDILHKDFVKTIQEQFKPVHNTLIDLRAGYQMAIDDTEFRIRQYDLVFNPFLSVIESVDAHKTIISREHRYWKSLSGAIIVTQFRLWIQVVHGQNALNKNIPYLKKVTHINQEDFGLNIVLKPDSSFKVILYNTLTSPIRFLYQLKKKLKAK